MNDQNEISVWDPFVRVAHWLLVIAFVVAYVTEGEPEVVHVWAGYTVAAYVGARIIWGFIGPKRARFSDFVYGPGAILAYLRGLLSRSAERYVGHSPAGGAMTIALLLSLGATTFFGMAHLAEEEGEGPLAPFIEQIKEVEHAALFITPAQAHEDEEGEHEESFFLEMHETFVNISLILVILHLGGVALASIVHKENLPRSMVTGRKRT